MYDSVSKTLFLGKKILYLPTCHSTNDIAAEIVRESIFPEGTVVITDHQTAGRGQRGNQWITSQGQNFTLSLVLRPSFLLVHEQFLLSQAVALGVRAYLRQYTPKALVKWPNDLYIDAEKVGGILIENVLQGTCIAHSVVGIGLNINQQQFQSLRSTSLGKSTGKVFSLNEELPQLLHWVESYYLRLRAGRRQEIRDEYLQYLLGLEQERTFRAGENAFSGCIIGITEVGKLQVRLADGTVSQFDVKEIEWLWEG
ncbi:biotin--[acetyl-CoA-carboxylase] ligase [Telluribacter sp. SYSU D00476]|uniref:biotin--[acetyl-CoA-carboxylase] ligase n=1 Tax=Telluribacter sp. SYSU D00476 TaxID=2811430 RepID=UPI001FF2DE02|nr:biotin--[acetyl-CoA-carboxylase] ligase [Telluribacter sp. SYSU D00476]